MLRARDIFSLSSRFSLANVLGGALSAGAYVIVARRLGPAGMGLLGLSQLWILVASFARPGMLQAGVREIQHAAGAGDPQRAEQVQDAALAGELAALAVTLALTLTAVLFWYDEPEMRRMAWLTAGVIAVNGLYQLIDGFQWAWQRYTLAARANLVMKLAQPTALLAGVYAAGVYGAVLAPAAAAAATAAFYCTQPGAVRWRPRWDPALLKRLLGVGVPLSLFGSLYWGFRASDRALTASLLTVTDLGYFTFVMTFINHGCQWVSDFLNVLQANLFSELGKAGRVRPLSERLQRLCLLVLTVTGTAAGLAQTAFHPAVALFVPKFLPGVPAFELLALNMVAITAPLLFNTVLTSAVVDQQWRVAALQAAGLAVNVALGWSFVNAGWGLSGIAWSSVFSQFLVTACAAALLHGHLFEDAPPGEAPRFYARMAALGALSVGVYFLLRSPMLAYPNEGHAWGLLAVRVAAVGALWGATGALVFYRWRSDVPKGSWLGV